jgi:hypothetical protein
MWHPPDELAARSEDHRGVHVRPCDAELLPGLLRQFPAAVQLDQAIQVALPQLNGPDDVQRVPHRVQAPDPLGQLERLFSPPDGRIVVAHPQHRPRSVVGAGRLPPGWKLLQTVTARPPPPRLGPGADLP